MQSPYFLARQPIVDREKQIIMYEVFLRSKETPHKYPENLPPQKATFIVIDLISSIGYRKLAGNKKLMINFPAEAIMAKTYLELLNSQKTVINVLKPSFRLTNKQWELLEKQLKTLKDEGFEMAFDMDLIRENPSLGWKFADYIVVDINKLRNIPNTLLKRKKCIVIKIETEKQFEEAKRKNCDLFEGFFFGKPEKVETEIPLYAYVSTILQVLKVIEKENDLNVIEEVIKTDPALVGRILKFINSAIFYIPKEVKSLRQALTLLGTTNLKRFLLVLLAIDLAESLQIPVKEYKKLIVSAFIAEELAKKLKIDENIAFLGGLFEGSDLVFNIPPEKLAVDLGLASEILEGYLGDEPKLYCLFLLAKTLAFQLNFDKNVKACLNRLKIAEEDLKTIYKIAREKTDALPV